MCAKNPEIKTLGVDTIISQLRAFGKTFKDSDPTACNVINMFADEFAKTTGETKAMMSVMDAHIEKQKIILANALNDLNVANAKLTAVAQLTNEFAAQCLNEKGGAE